MTPNEQLDRSELKMVLTQARDAVIRLAAEDNSSLNTSISEKVSNLVDDFLFVGDTDDVRYLQRHLKSPYAEEIRHALDSSSNSEDFAARIRKAEREKDEQIRDQQLSSIAQQQVKSGDLDGAAATSAKVHTPSVDLFVSIATAQHQAGNESEAEKSVDAAIHACFAARRSIYVPAPWQQLGQLASSLAAQQYDGGARRVLSKAMAELAVQDDQPGILWSDLVMNAIEVGDLSAAESALQKVDDPDYRNDLETRILVARARNADVHMGMTVAMQISDPESKAKVLCDLARSQAESGNAGAAAATLQYALETARQVDDYQVFLLNDIAWAQIDTGDRKGAEATLAAALKENERKRYGSDQVQGWDVIADTLAFLGHFDQAHEVAKKIDDSFFRGRALGFIAERQVEAGQPEVALEFAKGLKTPDEQAAMYLSIAHATIEQLKKTSS